MKDHLPTMSTKDVLERLEECIALLGSARAFADEFKISPQYVTDVRMGRRPPAQRICDALGIERAIVYRDRRK